MRTTVTIADPLLQEARARALQSGRTLGELIEDALREAFARAASGGERTAIDLPVSGGGGTLPGVDLTSNAALADYLDGVDGPHRR